MEFFNTSYLYNFPHHTNTCNVFNFFISNTHLFPINKLKVDQSFVRNMTTSANDASIAKSVILLGQSLNLKVIAEGVETAEQLSLLKQLGCDEVQGYLFSRPIPGEELEQLLRARLPGVGKFINSRDEFAGILSDG